MNSQYSQTLMDQRIFQCGLSVETVSVYLLCTGLADGDQDLTMAALLSVWSGDEPTLVRELDTLESKQIIRKCSTDPTCYEIQPYDRWVV